MIVYFALVRLNPAPLRRARRFLTSFLDSE